MNSQNRAPEPPTSPTNSPAKNPRPLIWAVAAGLGTLGILALLRSQTGPEATPTGTPSSIQATPQPRSNFSGQAAAPHSNPLSDSFSEPQLVFFVPDDNGNMKKRTLPPRGDIPREAGAAREKLATQAVQALMQAAPDIFPPGTALQSISVASGVASLNFSSAFAKPDFWQGSALTRATMDALAMTVAGTGSQIAGDKSEGVRILVEGKPLPTLGEMDLSTPYTPSTTAPPGSEP